MWLCTTLLQYQMNVFQHHLNARIVQPNREPQKLSLHHDTFQTTSADHVGAMMLGIDPEKSIYGACKVMDLIRTCGYNKQKQKESWGCKHFYDAGIASGTCLLIFLEGSMHGLRAED